MKRDGREQVSRTFRMDKSLVERIDEFSDRTGITRTFVMEKGAEEFMDRYDAFRKEACAE